MEKTPPEDKDLAVYQAQRAHELELNKATGAFEHALIAPLFLLNGGGAVAFLTLLGAASDKESSLKVSFGPAGLAVSFWALGLLTAAWGVRLGYRGQRDFTRATNARRKLMEHALIDRDSRLLTALAPLGPNDNHEWIAQTQKKAKKLRDQWLIFSALALSCFAAGVIGAAFAILRR